MKISIVTCDKPVEVVKKEPEFEFYLEKNYVGNCLMVRVKDENPKVNRFVLTINPDGTIKRHTSVTSTGPFKALPHDAAGRIKFEGE